MHTESLDAALADRLIETAEKMHQSREASFSFASEVEQVRQLCARVRARGARTNGEASVAAAGPRAARAVQRAASKDVPVEEDEVLVLFRGQHGADNKFEPNPGAIADTLEQPERRFRVRRVRRIHSKETTTDLQNHLNNARKELDRLDFQRGDQYTIQNNLRCLELIKHNIDEIKQGLKSKEE